MISRRMFGKGAAAMAVTRGDRLPGGRRPDQDYDPPGPLVAPGGRAGIFRGRLVVIGGSGPPGSGLYVYSPSPGAGNLIASIAAASGTDPYGNVVIGGAIAAYSKTGLAVDMSGGSFQLGKNSSGDETTSYATTGIIQGGTQLMQILQGAAGSTLDLGGGSSIWSLIQAFATQFQIGSGTAATATLLEVEGTAALKNASAPAAVVGYAEPFAIGGNLAFVNGLTGDGATYDTGRRTLFATGQTVNSTGFVNITGVGALNLGIGTYRIEGKIHIVTGVAGGAAELKFVTGGGIVLTGTAVCRESKVPVAAAVTWGQGNVISLSGATVFTSSALGAADTMIDIDNMHAVVTTAGTLTPQVAVTIAADNYSIASDSYFEIFPVN